MNHRIYRFWPKKVICLLYFAVCIFFFLPPPSFGQPPPRLIVMASLFPLQEFARAVGGEKVRAFLLVPPGAEAHTWEPKPSDVEKISQADIFIYIGPAMEPWVDKILQTVKGKRLLVVEASRGIPLLKSKDSHHHSHSKKMDAHIWLDFSLNLIIIDAIEAAFSTKDSAHKSFYKNNAEEYKKKLEDLDQKYSKSLAKCRQRHILLSGHAAFAYLAKRYGLRQIALSGISPNAEPTPKKMAELVAATRKYGIKFIYAEDLVHPKLARVLAKEAGVGILSLNPGHNLTPEMIKQNITFLELMEKNLVSLQQGLDCEKQ